ncbi:uncharacterized protein DFL_005338 [Arthrobotrys flagrans]|uniref:Tachykinin family protein n=1 Tax=Arthrobotrys flagrans TaxID=97331 RepID=A0A437A7D0_ARTFL|nr:hypothetical protein DFL_005338 [Arthrobotrys flagrans]
MEFQFIDNTNIDASARKQIRSSVMRGRNTGKTRPRKEPIRHSKPRVLIPGVANINRKGLDGNSASPEDTVGRMLKTVGNEFSVLRYPKPLEPHVQRVVRQFMEMTSSIIYPKELCINVQESHAIWFEFFQSDEAFFHCLLAMAQALSDWRQGSQGESIKVIGYLENTYRCINEKLKKEGTPDDATVAVVMSITMHNNLLSAPGGAEVHLNALQKMVELRGGLSSFPAMLLLHKICRTDIEFSLQSGSLPRFYRDEFPYTTIRSSPLWLDTTYEAFITTTNTQIYNPNIQSVFRDMLCASRFINTLKTTKQKIEPLMFQEILISMGYRLMYTSPLDGVRPLDAADDVCHLALLAMLTTMLIRSGHTKLSYPFLSRLFHDAIIKIADDPKIDDRFLLWLLFMAGISIFDVRDDTWLLLKLQVSMSRMKLESWQSVQIVLRGYPWTDYFHDEPGLKLWGITSKS